MNKLSYKRNRVQSNEFLVYQKIEYTNKNNIKYKTSTGAAHDTMCDTWASSKGENATALQQNTKYFSSFTLKSPPKRIMT